MILSIFQGKKKFFCSLCLFYSENCHAISIIFLSLIICRLVQALRVILQVAFWGVINDFGYLIVELDFVCENFDQNPAI